MVKGYRELIKNYFENHSFVESNIKSFDNFLKKELQGIIDENNEIIPTILPPGIKEFKIKFGKIEVGKPQITEADGSKRDVFPVEARLRKLTYAAPIYLDVKAYIDGIERESFIANIGKLPIMVKSSFCYLNGMSRESLLEAGEDPNDPGGYFILNGNERVLITVEDLAANKLFVEHSQTGPSKYHGRIFSENGTLRVPHTIEQMKNGIMYLSFTRFRRVPMIVFIKALGLVKDQEITNIINENKTYDSIFINLLEFVGIKSKDDALEHLAKKIGLMQGKEQATDRVNELLDRYLLPHLGTRKEDRLAKAYNLCKYIKKFLMISVDKVALPDKDHYKNKRLRQSGDLLADLFRVNFRSLVQDMLYNFQRLVKRGKFQSIKIIIRDQLLTGRVKSAMATGAWVGGRKGISQNIDRTNYLATLSHLQRVVSLLSATQENFEARALHGTHFGRLCPVETPEGTPIGLRKNLALMCSITQEGYQEDKIKKILEANGVKLL